MGVQQNNVHFVCGGEKANFHKDVRKILKKRVRGIGQGGLVILLDSQCIIKTEQLNRTKWGGQKYSQRHLGS